MSLDLRNKVYVLDGGMGTTLQKSGIEYEGDSAEFIANNPDVVKGVHDKYVDAGSDIVYAASFSLNRFAAEHMSIGIEEAIRNVMTAADGARKRAAEELGKRVYVALDIGPLGRLLEPMGTLHFEEAYDAFAEIVDAGKDKADLIVIETMTDLYEVKAAVLAAKEHADLPVMVSMSFEEGGRTFTGTSLEAMAITLEGLGVDAMGINCSLGPEEIYPMIQELRSYTSLPVFAKPNAGLPDPMTGDYPMDAEQFTDKIRLYAESGVNILGGCCGTDPDYVAGIRKVADGCSPKVGEAFDASPAKGALRVCSGNKVVTVDHVTPIGERINPTGKKKLKQALIDEDYDYIFEQAVSQTGSGAEILDVNVGVPQIDDVVLLPKVVKKLQSITNAPLQIDSGNPEAIEAALRVYNGKAIVNSVNGEAEVLDRILPSVKKYGAAVVGLTLDENGIPPTAEERYEIAERILKRCLDYGIKKEDVIIDCLTLTVSAQQKEVVETLKAMRMVKERLGLKLALGVSNISFGLPARAIVNRTFLTMTMECGLDLPIINPGSEDMMASIYAFHVLHNIDEHSVKYIERYGNVEVKGTVITAKGEGMSASGAGENKAGGENQNTSSKNDDKSTQSTKNSTAHDIFYTVGNGMSGETTQLVGELLKSCDEMTIVNDYLIPALDKVGRDFEDGVVFLPQMIQAASAAQAGFDVVKAQMEKSGKTQVSQGPVAVATVKGDVHDIGKNIVKVIMENYGFEIIDLGKDVDPQVIVDTVVSKDIKMLGLSALMTTTLPAMAETIEKVKAAKPDCKIWVGGAVLTADFAEKIGADYYCRDAMKSVEAAQEVFNGTI